MFAFAVKFVFMLLFAFAVKFAFALSFAFVVSFAFALLGLHDSALSLLVKHKGSIAELQNTTCHIDRMIEQ